MMYFKPENVRAIIAKAGSTYFVNYFELCIRLIVGISFVNVKSNYETYYCVFGYFLIVSALVLMVVPIGIHNRFSVKAAQFLNPMYLKIAAPIALMAGVFIIYTLLK